MLTIKRFLAALLCVRLTGSLLRGFENFQALEAAPIGLPQTKALTGNVHPSLGQLQQKPIFKGKPHLTQAKAILSKHVPTSASPSASGHPSGKSRQPQNGAAAEPEHFRSLNRPSAHPVTGHKPGPSRHSHLSRAKPAASDSMFDEAAAVAAAAASKSAQDGAMQHRITSQKGKHCMLERPERTSCEVLDGIDWS